MALMAEGWRYVLCSQWRAAQSSAGQVSILPLRSSVFSRSVGQRHSSGSAVLIGDESAVGRHDSPNTARRPYVSEDGPLQRTPRWKSRCPFRVGRTGSDNLPVYLQKRLNGNTMLTLVRKVGGDDEALRRELEVLCQKKVHVGRSGYLEINGNHKNKVKAYLQSIGY
mmetsp:Transcript_10113/g.22748  ORF Transcript_10113/g.22748 Transcript_10113/m.22748 type:complete len:167 (+) Transcript_10113:118-618(+)|eukprot:CAMPEP_0178439178 /NCGR_PEP_ID=MMETSP0689_2-20121128/36013_1 /TAXON_ID=160604 /ORGANISM="Amphidinium massartii, Strain CS-259" /LENGTH=166 /DNA_ID=CAMNT_0020061681 /DNA_START=55 /DNA_END=555 /DNA_ORIENTATION=-